MAVVAGVIAAAWAILLGAAYLACAVLRLGRSGSVVVVATAYSICAAAALAWLGLGPAGVLGATGLLLPCAVALAVVAFYPAHRRSGR